MENNYSDTLIKLYEADETSTLDIDKFLNTVAGLIVSNQGKIKYSYLKTIFYSKDLKYEDFLLWSFFATAIAKNIPLGTGRDFKEREAAASARAVLTFLYTRTDEDRMIDYSKTEQAAKVGLLALKRHDPADDDTFHAGAGSRLADFEAIDDSSLIFEMKAGTSPSSYHDANRLIRPTIGGKGYSCYVLSDPGQVIVPNANILLEGFIPVYREYSEFNRILTKDYRVLYGNIGQNLKTLDTILASKGFIWPK